MVKSGSYMAAGLGIAAVIGLGGAVYVYSKPSTQTGKPPSSTQTLSSIKLSANYTSIISGSNVTFKAVAYDQNDKVMANSPLILFDEQTKTSVPMGNTDSSGSISSTIKFSTAGTFVIYAEGQNSSPKSNTITITVKPNPTPVLTTLKLTESASVITAGQDDSFTVHALDQFGNAMAGIAVTLLGSEGTDATQKTDSGGAAVYSNVPFPNAGSFSFKATAANLTSNGVTVTVNNPAPTVYTCYVPRCKTFNLLGHTYTTCVTNTYTSSTPCPSNASSASNACATINC